MSRMSRKESCHLQKILPKQTQVELLKNPKSLRLVSFKVVVLLISTSFLHSPGHGGSTSAVAWMHKRFNSSFIFEAKFPPFVKGH